MTNRGERLTIERYFSQFGDPYEDLEGVINYSPRPVEIRDDKGNIVEKFIL